MRGEELRGIHEHLRLSQRQMGALMDVSYQVISRAEAAEAVDNRTALAALYLAEHPELTFEALD